MRAIYKSLKLYIEDSEGASAVEYAILVALISAVIIVTVGFLGTNTRDSFNSVSPAFDTDNQKECPDGTIKGHDCGN